MARCDSYDRGECTWGACKLAPWVRDGWGNAKDWWAPASRDGFQETLTPTVGAVVVFGPGYLYDPQFGHLGVVTSVPDAQHFTVREMNFSHFNAYDDRLALYHDVVTFILPPAVEPGQGGSGLINLGGPPKQDLEYAWSTLSDFWNYVIDAETIGLINITTALETIS